MTASALEWDQTGQRLYETGVDHGALYVADENGQYPTGVAWNGLTTVTESPSGADSNPQYADNIKYLDLRSAEEFGGTIEALTYPDEFAQCDGTASPVKGLYVGQQARKMFGLAYRSKVGNDVAGQDFGYKLHLIYGATAAPSEKAYGTVNDSPAAIALSWDITTNPVDPGNGLKPTALLVIDSTKVAADALTAIETALFGEGAHLPLPSEVITMLGGSAPPAWEATHDYAVGDQVTINSAVLTATVGGTSGTTAPAVPAAVGDTVVDGGVTWTRES